jgi:TRAP transporter 4TM/12TM fusion protein
VIKQALKFIFLSKGGTKEFKGNTYLMVKLFALLICLYHVYAVVFYQVEPITHRIVHVATFMIFTFLTTSFLEKENTITKVIDGVFLLAAAATSIYLLVSSSRYVYHIKGIDLITTADIFFGILLMVLIWEGARRLAGPAISMLSFLFFAYAAFLSQYCSGVLYARAPSIKAIIEEMVISTNGIFGAPIGVTATYLFIFLLFGGFLDKSGGGEAFLKLSNALAGSARGGPAKVSVISSGLFGSISGSPPANVATTGVFTIPAMMRTGYKPATAGAVEAAASTGGAIMPPVMGAVALLMAEVTGISYAKIIAAAAIPAIMYYVGIGVQVHLEAVRMGIKGLPKDQLPPFKPSLLRGMLYLSPLIILVIVLVLGFSTTRAASLAAAITMLFLLFLPTQINGISGDSRSRGNTFVDALAHTTTQTRMLSACSAAAGILSGALFMSGLAGKIGSILMGIAGTSLGLALVIAAIMCIILGMGVPIIVVYIIASAIVIPSLIEMGVPVLAAHFFIMYMATTSHITPPVAFAAYVGASLAGSPPMKTGFIAMRLAIAAYIVPFVFVYQPALLLIGEPLQIVIAVITALCGITFVSCGVAGYWFKNLSFVYRCVFVVCGLLMIYPGATTDLIGLVGALGLSVYLYLSCRKSTEDNLATVIPK